MSVQCSGGRVVEQTRVGESKEFFWFILVLVWTVCDCSTYLLRVSAYIEGKRSSAKGPPHGARSRIFVFLNKNWVRPFLTQNFGSGLVAGAL